MSIKGMKNSNSRKLFKTAAIAIFTLILAGRFFIVDPVHTAIKHPDTIEELRRLLYDHAGITYTAR